MWSPAKGQPVSKKEAIGRRLFGDWRATKEREGIAGKPKLEVFVESRSGKDLSVDRLGLHQADPDVEAALLHLCKAHSTMLQKPFAGWAKFQVEQLMVQPLVGLNIGVKATPIDAPIQERNPYHADVETGSLSKVERNLVAFVLAQKCSVPETDQSDDAGPLAKVIDYLLGLKNRLKVLLAFGRKN